MAMMMIIVTIMMQMTSLGPTDELDPSSLRLHEVIGQGYFGVVYRATMTVCFAVSEAEFSL